MGEGFRVDAHWLSGYATFLYGETDGGANGSLRVVRNHIDNFCRSTDGFEGLMTGLKGVVDGYADATHDRLTNLMVVGNGTANQLYHVADEVKQVAGELITKLNDVVKKFKSKLPGFWVGFWNSFTGSADKKHREAAEFLCAHQDLFNGAGELVNGIRRLIDEVERVVDALKEPIDHVRQINDEITRIQSTINETKEQLATAADLAELADPSGFLNAPTGAYKLPANPEEPGK